MRRRSLLLALGLAIPAALVGCDAPRPVNQRDRQDKPANQLGKQIDFTGTVQRNSDIADAAQAVRERVEQFDPNLMNEVLAEMSVLVSEIRARVIAIPEDAGQNWSNAIDAARIQSLSDSLQHLTEQATTTVTAIDIDTVNKTLVEFRAVVAELADKIESLDIAAANKLVADVDSLAPELRESIAETKALAADMRTTVASLPIARVENSLTQIELAGAAVAPTLRRLVTILAVSLVGLAIALIWCAVWIGRVVGRERSHISH